MATNAQSQQVRNRYIKLIHVARRELCLDEPTYRTILASAGKADSTADMGVPALMAVLERLKKSGFKVRPKAGDRSQTINPDASKVRALWLFLHALGVVEDPSEMALATYTKRIAKVDDLRWARGDALTALIETLKKWAMRFLPAAVAALRQEVVRMHQANPLSAAQIECVEAAQKYLANGQGFDMHWLAWEALMQVLGRPVAGEIKRIAS